jgi:hypothetical protein
MNELMNECIHCGGGACVCARACMSVRVSVHSHGCMDTSTHDYCCCHRHHVMVSLWQER